MGMHGVEEVVAVDDNLGVHGGHYDGLDNRTRLGDSRRRDPLLTRRRAPPGGVEKVLTPLPELFDNGDT